MRVGIIGCGLMGARRAAHLAPDDELVATYDPAPKWPKATDAMRAVRVDDVLGIFARKPQAIIIGTTHDGLAPMTTACLDQSSAPILLEKPCSMTGQEFEMLAAMSEHGEPCQIIPGYTLRHYPGIREAKRILDSEELGEPLYMRAMYGHGGDPGWRAEQGGELLDQGSHLIDLSAWLMGRRDKWTADVTTHTAMLSASGIQLCASWNEWDPQFGFSVTCSKAMLRVWGLGGPYGKHGLRVIFKDAPNRTYEYGDARDEALTSEWLAFKAAIAKPYDPAPLEDAAYVLRITDEARKT
jgi:predicted dehydrogenase